MSTFSIFANSVFLAWTAQYIKSWMQNFSIFYKTAEGEHEIPKTSYKGQCWLVFTVHFCLQGGVTNFAAVLTTAMDTFDKKPFFNPWVCKLFLSKM